MTDRIKVFEEKARKGAPLWLWLLPLVLLLLAALAYFFTHRENALAPTAQQASALPDLGTVHFDSDKATLTPEGQSTLQQAATAMKANPKLHLRLEGYTDSTGNAPHNADLSQQRAVAVASYLKGQGIEGSRLTGAGFGPSKPTDTNNTEAGKADNRRVELFSQQ